MLQPGYVAAVLAGVVGKQAHIRCASPPCALQCEPNTPGRCKADACMGGRSRDAAGLCSLNCKGLYGIACRYVWGEEGGGPQARERRRLERRGVRAAAGRRCALQPAEQPAFLATPAPVQRLQRCRLHTAGRRIQERPVAVHWAGPLVCLFLTTVDPWPRMRRCRAAFPPHPTPLPRRTTGPMLCLVVFYFLYHLLLSGLPGSSSSLASITRFLRNPRGPPPPPPSRCCAVVHPIHSCS